MSHTDFATPAAVAGRWHGSLKAALKITRGWSFGVSFGLMASALLVMAPVQDVQAFDLRSLLHGAPTPGPKAAPPAQLASVSRAAGVAADAQVEDFLRAYAAALKAREGGAMLARLSERYSIEDLPADAKPADFFVQAVERIASPEQMVIQAITAQGEQRLVKVELRFSNERVVARTLRFDAAGKLLSSDLFRLQRHGQAG